MRSEEDMVRRMEAMVKHWVPASSLLEECCRGSLGNADAVQRLATLTFSPGALRAMFRQNMMMDSRLILAGVKLPTLVLHHSGCCRSCLMPKRGSCGSVRRLSKRYPSINSLAVHCATSHACRHAHCTIFSPVCRHCTSPRAHVALTIESVAGIKSS